MDCNITTVARDAHKSTISRSKLIKIQNPSTTSFHSNKIFTRMPFSLQLKLSGIHTHFSFSIYAEGYHCIELPYPKIYYEF